MIVEVKPSGVFVVALAAILLSLPACRQEDGAERVVRIGSFPNITHVQALVARNMSREGKGWFERYLPGYTVQWQTFNAGPSAAEAIFGRTVDLTYILCRLFRAGVATAHRGRQWWSCAAGESR